MAIVLDLMVAQVSGLYEAQGYQQVIKLEQVCQG